MTDEKSRRWARLASVGATRPDVPTPADEARMSATILELPKPLIRKHASKPERASVIIMLTIAAWNKSMFPEEKQPAIEKDLIDCFVPKDGNLLRL